VQPDHREERRNEKEEQMPSGVTFAESGLIRAYQSVDDEPDRASIIRQYAGINNLSLGRAEDELGVWVHLLARQRSEPHFAD
jgi:hypothetical protein